MIGQIHINVPRYESVIIRRLECMGCGYKDRLFVTTMEEWYGQRGTCLRCGEQFADGEWLARPFMRGWRKKNIENAKKLFRKFKAIDSVEKVAKV